MLNEVSWALNYPTLNRGTAWKATRYTANEVTPTLTATVYDAANAYLTGDLVVLTSSDSDVYMCIFNCEAQTPSGTSDSWEWILIDEPVNGYNINVVDYAAWDTEEDCYVMYFDNDNSDFEIAQWPSPSIVPRNPLTGEHGSYICLFDRVYECMDKTCNDPYLLHWRQDRTGDFWAWIE